MVLGYETNNDPNSPYYGQRYYVEPGTNSGRAGAYHVYASGVKVFVPDVAPLPITPQGGVAAPAPAAPAPAPVAAAPAYTPPTPTNASGGIPGSGALTPQQQQAIYEKEKASGAFSHSAAATETPNNPAPSMNPILVSNPRPDPSTGGTTDPSSSGGNTPVNPIVTGINNPDPSTGGTTGSDPSAGNTPDPSTGTSDGGTAAPIGATGGSATPVASSSDNSNSSGSTDSGAPAPAVGGTHTVVHGDTMWGIAQATGVPLSQLEALNPQIKNPELIFPGQQINLGGATDASATSGGGSTGTDAGGTHTVVHGDTMWGIAQSNGMPLSKLEALNPQVKNPELIFPGQQLNLGGAPAATSAPAAGATDSSDGSTVTQSSAIFPRSSSYQTPGAASQTETTADAKPAGWGNGTNSVPSDPAKGVIEVVTNPTTDPLKINENKSHSV